MVSEMTDEIGNATSILVVGVNLGHSAIAPKLIAGHVQYKVPAGGTPPAHPGPTIMLRQ